MKRKFIQKLLLALATIALLFSLSAVAVAAEEIPSASEGKITDDTAEVPSATVDGEAAEGNIFEEAFTALEGFSSEILCALSFIGSLIIAALLVSGVLQ